MKRLLRPAVEREARATLREEALRRAVTDFGANLRSLLLAPPMRPAAAVVGLDPAYRTGCKLAAVDATGALVETSVVHLPGFGGGGGGGGGGGSGRRGSGRGGGGGGKGGGGGGGEGGGEAGAKLRAFCERHGVRAVAIGDGVGTREAEQLVAATFSSSSTSTASKSTTTTLKKQSSSSSSGKIGWRVVSEAGASVYSASEVAVAELPDVDVSLRGAVSIARRLQDPMAELVKIDPQSLGVGLYQHDVKDKELALELAAVVESAVAAAGVSLNTASVSLLSRVPGLSKSTVRKGKGGGLSRGVREGLGERDCTTSCTLV